MSHSISTHSKGDLLNGDVNESINNIIYDYILFTDKIKLNGTRTAIFFTNILVHLAKTFFIIIITTSMNVQKIEIEVILELDSAEKLKEAQSIIDRLGLKSFMLERNISDEIIGLSKTLCLHRQTRPTMFPDI